MFIYRLYVNFSSLSGSRRCQPLLSIDAIIQLNLHAFLSPVAMEDALVLRMLIQLSILIVILLELVHLLVRPYLGDLHVYLGPSFEKHEETNILAVVYSLGLVLPTTWS